MTKSSRDITAGMVRVSFEEHEQLAFNAWMDIRIKRAQDWDIESTNPHMRTEQSEPIMIDSISVDEDLFVPYRNESTEQSIMSSMQGFEDF